MKKSGYEDSFQRYDVVLHDACPQSVGNYTVNSVDTATIDTPDSIGILIAGHFTGSFSTEGGAVSKTTL
jgi:hypothetical protein